MSEEYLQDNSAYYRAGTVMLNGKRYEVLQPDGTRLCDVESCGDSPAEQIGDKWLCASCQEERCPECGGDDLELQTELGSAGTYENPPEYYEAQICNVCGWVCEL